MTAVLGSSFHASPHSGSMWERLRGVIAVRHEHRERALAQVLLAVCARHAMVSKT